MVATLVLSKYEVEGLRQRYWNGQQNTPKADEAQSCDNLQVLNYDLKPTSDAPAGFLGRHQYLDVQILVKDEENNEHIKLLRFFAKSAPLEIASRMEYLDEFGVFKKEILIYRDVLPRIENIFPGIAPKCFYADNNLLIFEDLGVQGYKMGAARDGLLDYRHLNCALRTLAALHAGSIVYELRAKQNLNEIHANALLENAYPINVPDTQVRVRNFLKVIDVLKEILRTLPKYATQLDYILAELPKRMRSIFEMSKVSKKYKNVLSHGDLWANNLMFQYGKYGDTPIQCRFVDFQLARYAPPFLDLLTVLTIPTSRQFRAQHLEELLANYYRFMTEFLKCEGLAVEDFLPQDQYNAGVKEFRLYGLIESCLFTHLTALPPELTQSLTGSTSGFEEFFDTKRIEICMTAFKTDAVYRERLTDMIEDLVDNFILI